MALVRNIYAQARMETLEVALNSNGARLLDVLSIVCLSVGLAIFNLVIYALVATSYFPSRGGSRAGAVDVAAPVHPSVVLSHSSPLLQIPITFTANTPLALFLDPSLFPRYPTSFIRPSRPAALLLY